MACRKRPGQVQASGGPSLAASVYDAPPDSEPFANGLRDHRCRRMCSWADLARRLPDPSNGCWASMHIVCVGEALAFQRIVWRCTRESRRWQFSESEDQSRHMLSRYTNLMYSGIQHVQCPPHFLLFSHVVTSIYRPSVSLRHSHVSKWSLLVIYVDTGACDSESTSNHAV